MITLDLTPNELNFVEYESQKQGITVQEYFKNMLSQLMTKRTPNAQTLQAIHELESGKGVKFDDDFRKS